MKAIWNNTIIAESSNTRVVENNHYFPLESVHKEFLQPSDTHTTCGWKGIAFYYTIMAEGKSNPDSAWFYPDPKDAAKEIKNYVAFWKGVKIIE